MVALHPLCHRMIHAHFTNAELARLGDERDAQMKRETLTKFVVWVAKKSTDFHAPTRRRN